MTGLDDLREALVHRADTYKTLCDTLRDSTEPVAYEQWLRARGARVALWGAIKLVDELRSTGALRDAGRGGYDGLTGLAEMVEAERQDALRKFQADDLEAL